MNGKRERLCTYCHRSLFYPPHVYLDLCSCKVYQYWDHLCLLPAEERESVIVTIYDVENPCNHYFHLKCIGAHRSYCHKFLNHPPDRKTPCPAFFCSATYDDSSTLNFIPLKLYTAQYQQQNPEWNIVSEFPVLFTDLD